MSVRDIPLESWPRRAALQHFRATSQPAFSVTVRVDVSGLAERAARHGATPWLAYHHAAIEAANEVDAMRQVMTASGGVQEFDVIHGSTTVLRGDGSFGIVSLGREPELARFAATARPRVLRVREASGGLFEGDEPVGPVESLIHMTTLPWLAFTAFTHARHTGDDRPKFAFGRFTDEGGRRWMPVAVDVHHALVDGVHVGRFFERLQARLDAV
jgi:chloramphenicol O-acetyltransferase type A